MVEIFHKRKFSHNSKNAINLELATLLKDAFIEHGGGNNYKINIDSLQKEYTAISRKDTPSPSRATGPPWPSGMLLTNV